MTDELEPGRYPIPHRVVVRTADLRRMTLLERARACARAGIGEREIPALLKALAPGGGADPELVERAATLVYAMAYELERRLDPEIGWTAAQAWDVVLDLGSPRDPIAEAEAETRVEASIATGLPPDQAGDVTLAELEAYGRIRTEQARAMQRATRRRR